MRLHFHFFFFFYARVLAFMRQYALFSGSRALFTRPTSTLFRKKNIKNESHGTIHTFKNYFVTVFSIFSFNKISNIQMDPKCAFGYKLKSQLILLFSLFLLLFMDPIALFGTVHGSHYTILANFYLYLQYFQQKNFSLSKINKRIPNRP